MDETNDIKHLVLTLREGDCVHVSGGVDVRVVRTQAGRVALMFEATEDVKIYREKRGVHDAINDRCRVL